MTKQAIELKVRKTLQYLDEVETVKASPYFEVRLRQRLQALQPGDKQPVQNRVRKHWQVVLAPVMVAAGIALGVLIGYHAVPENRAQEINSFASAYGLDAPEVSDYMLTTGEQE